MNNVFLLLLGISFLCIPIFLTWALINLIRKKPVKKHLKQSCISFLIMIASFLGVGFTAESISAESIIITVPDYQEEYDINTTIPIEISVFPENASISSFKYMVNNEILTFSGSEIITGSTEGTCEIYVESDGIKSNSISISIVDKASQKAAQKAEEKQIVEEQAAKEAEDKRLAEEQAAKEAEEKLLAEAQAAKEAEKQQLAEQAAKAAEDKKLTEEAEQENIEDEQTVAQASQSQSSGTSSSPSGDSSNFNTYDNADQQQTSASYVLNTSTKRFHYPSCKSVKKIAPQNYATSNSSREELIAQDYKPCGNCTP